jgi:mRNA interferase RelE/StbE
MSMLYRILMTKQADKQFEHLQKKDQKRVQAAFEVLKENPTAGKLLEGKFKGLRTLRIWPYRIIYAINHGIITVTVVKIGHRKDVYQ